ncbi:MAG: hypothetical protein ACYDDA_02345 [Acidiferrobacteraceae bacterium]
MPERGRDHDRVVWLTELGRLDLAFVLMPGELSSPRSEKDYTHLGFALGRVPRCGRGARADA